MNLTVIDHPLARHDLTVLRDRDTPPEEFRNAARRLTYSLVMEATRRVPLNKSTIESPLEPTAGYELGEVAAVAVLRAGLGMLDAVLDLIPEVKVGFAGVQRNEETAEPMEYYAKMPELENASVLILERMYEDHPDTQIVAAALDRELNDHFYIVPGLGDMGDRLFGTL